MLLFEFRACSRLNSPVPLSGAAACTPHHSPPWLRPPVPPPGCPTTSCGEENLLMLPGDRYRHESVLVHEFG